MTTRAGCTIVCLATVMVVAALTTSSGHAVLPEPDAARLPRWHGFNLQGMFWGDGTSAPLRESDFQSIAAAGFNFVRIPVSYRAITSADDFRRIDPTRLQPLDGAIAWGKQYGIHVCLALFQVPGFCITPEPNPRWPADWDLWRDAAPQAVFAGYWETLAAHYKDTPSRDLSFNLINENRWDTPEADYAAVMRRAIAAIRAHDPRRLIVVDGLKTATTPCWSLADAGVAQALHLYAPMAITHYGVDWLTDAPSVCPTQWPAPLVSRHLYGPTFAEHAPLVIAGDFPTAHHVTVTVEDVVFGAAEPLTLRMAVDVGPGVAHTFALPAHGRGRYLADYDLYVCRTNRMLTLAIPAGSTNVCIEVTAGNRLTLGALTVREDDGRHTHSIIPIRRDWGSQQPRLHYTPAGGVTAPAMADRDWLRTQYVAPFRELERHGVGVMVMEFGCYNKTPHDVAMAWLTDCLTLFDEADWGWALWQWRGPFGPTDHGRPLPRGADVDGGAIDRTMLELLQRFATPGAAR